MLSCYLQILCLFELFTADYTTVNLFILDHPQMSEYEGIVGAGVFKQVSIKCIYLPTVQGKASKLLSTVWKSMAPFGCVSFSFSSIR